MKIWCLFSVDNEYDQPANNLVCWWMIKPSMSRLIEVLGTHDDISLNQLLVGKVIRLLDVDYRLELVENNVILDHDYGQDIPQLPSNSCPDCTKGELVERINSKTLHTFMGCNNFPLCGYTIRGGTNPPPENKRYITSPNDEDFGDEDGWGDYNDEF